MAIHADLEPRRGGMCDIGFVCNVVRSCQLATMRESYFVAFEYEFRIFQILLDLAMDEVQQLISVPLDCGELLDSHTSDCEIGLRGPQWRVDPNEVEVRHRLPPLPSRSNYVC